MLNLKSIGVFLGIAFAFTGCGKDDSQNSGRDQDPSNGGSDSEGNGNRDSYFSDIRDARVPICAKGQIFAFEKCWDSVEINDNRTITLKNATRNLNLINQGIISEELMSAYELYSSCTPGENGSFDIDYYLRSLPLIGNVEAWYWFLPGKFSVYNNSPNRDCKPKNKEIREFNIDLKNFISDKKYWYVNGTLNLCGKQFSLPIMQKDVEEACGVYHGRDLVGRIHKSDDYNIRITYSENGKNPGEFTSKTNRVVSMINFASPFVP